MYVVVVYYVVCFFPGCFSRYLRFHSGVVRIRSTTPVRLLLGLVLLPCGISGKMTIPSKSLLSLLASCSLYRYVALLPLAISCLPYCHVKPLTILPSKPLFGYVTAYAQAPLIALLVAGEVEAGSMLEHGYFGISQYLLFN